MPVRSFDEPIDDAERSERKTMLKCSHSWCIIKVPVIVYGALKLATLANIPRPVVVRTPPFAITEEPPYGKITDHLPKSTEALLKSSVRRTCADKAKGRIARMANLCFIVEVGCGRENKGSGRVLVYDHLADTVRKGQLIRVMRGGVWSESSYGLQLALASKFPITSPRMTVKVRLPESRSTPGR